MMAPGTQVHVKFLHDGAEKNATVTLAELPVDGGAAPRPGGGGRNYNQSPDRGSGQGYGHSSNPGDYRGSGQGYARGPDRGDPSNGLASGLDGVAVQNLDAQSARQLRLSPMTRGVVVTDVTQGTPAGMSGLQPGDLIQEVDHARIYTTNDFDRALRRSPGHTVLLLVNRQGSTIYLAIQPR
jgi:S1-C subfamily serine protease